MTGGEGAGFGPSPHRVHRLARMHGALALAWTGLMVPAVLWWKQSITFLVIVSVYANIAAEAAAWQATRAELREARREDDDA